MMTDYGVAPASDESLDAALAMFEASVGLPVRTPPPRTAARVSGTHDAAQAVAAVTAAREEPATPKAYEDTEAGDSLALCERLFSPRVVSPPSPQPRGNSGYRAASAEDTEVGHPARSVPFPSRASNAPPLRRHRPLLSSTRLLGYLSWCVGPAELQAARARSAFRWQPSASPRPQPPSLPRASLTPPPLPPTGLGASA